MNLSIKKNKKKRKNITKIIKNQKDTKILLKTLKPLSA